MNRDAAFVVAFMGVVVALLCVRVWQAEQAPKRLMVSHLQLQQQFQAAIELASRGPK